MPRFKCLYCGNSGPCIKKNKIFCNTTCKFRYYNLKKINHHVQKFSEAINHHHKTFSRDGGNNNTENLVVLCNKHHAKLHTLERFYRNNHVKKTFEQLYNELIRREK